MADLSRQAHHPMIVTSAAAAYCYDRVNHVIMSLVWPVLTNGNFPAIVAALVCLQTIIFLENGFWRIQDIFWRPVLLSLHYGTRARQQSRATVMGST
jgi:hypothetical protein